MKVKCRCYAFIEIYGVVWNRFRNARYFLVYYSQVRVFNGMWSIYCCIKFVFAITMKQTIHFRSFAQYTHHYVLLGLSRSFTWQWVGPWSLLVQSLWCSEPGGGYKGALIKRSIIYQIIRPPWGLELRSSSCMFYLVSTILKNYEDEFQRYWWWGCLEDWFGVLYSIPKLFFLNWFSSYNFDEGPMVTP